MQQQRGHTIWLQTADDTGKLLVEFSSPVSDCTKLGETANFQNWPTKPRFACPRCGTKFIVDMLGDAFQHHELTAFGSKAKEVFNVYCLSCSNNCDPQHSLPRQEQNWQWRQMPIYEEKEGLAWVEITNNICISKVVANGFVYRPGLLQFKSPCKHCGAAVSIPTSIGMPLEMVVDAIEPSAKAHVICDSCSDKGREKLVY